MTVEVLAPRRADDTLLRLSHGIALLNRDRLAAEGHSVTLFDGGLCVESQLCRIATPFDGTAFFGHGYPEHLSGSDERPLFSGNGISRLSSRWLHAFACDAAAGFAGAAISAGATLVVAYAGTLRSDWSLSELPSDIEADVALFVSEVTSSLAFGVRDERSLRAALFPPLERITAWCDENRQSNEVRRFCEALYRSLRVLPS